MHTKTAGKTLCVLAILATIIIAACAQPEADISDQPDQSTPSSHATPTPQGSQLPPPPTPPPAHTFASADPISGRTTPAPHIRFSPTAAPQPTPQNTAPQHATDGYPDALLDAFATCRGLYHGQSAARRRHAAVQALRNEYHTIQDLADIVARHCMGEQDISPTPSPAQPTATHPPPTDVHTPQPAFTATDPSPTTVSQQPQPTRQRWFVNADRHPTVAHRLRRNAWILPTATDQQALTALHILELADAAGAAFAHETMNMPFLSDPTYEDAAAVHGLHLTAEQHPDELPNLLQHPELSDGIQDHHAARIAVLPTALSHGLDFANSLFDPTASLQRRQVTVGDQHRFTIEIVRQNTHQPHEVHVIDSAVRAIQYLAALHHFQPKHRFLPILIAPPSTAQHHGMFQHSHIVIDPTYDVPADHSASRSANTIIAHELAHYWWTSNQHWVDEGLADALAVLSQSLSIPNKPPCPQYPNIHALIEAGVDENHDDFICHYAMGSRLFLDLHRNMSETSFRASIRRLHRTAQHTTAGIAQVRAAFPSQIQLIERHYNRPIKQSPTAPPAPPTIDPSLPDFNGQVDQAYITLRYEGPATSNFSASVHTGAVLLNIEYSFDYSGAPAQIPIEVTVIYQDGLPIVQHSARLDFNPHYQGATYSAAFQPPGRKWTPGRYEAHVHQRQQRIAHVTFTITP